MKKIITFLLSVTLLMNYVNLAANEYIYSENEQKNRFENDLCEIRIFMWNTGGTGWHNNTGIEITVDGVDYGIVKLPHAFETYEGEETVLIPSGEVLFSWIGNFQYTLYGFKIYNFSDELIYTSPNAQLPVGVFFNYTNECPHYVECLPVTDFEGVYIAESHQVHLSWKTPESDEVISINIYRNDILIDSLPSSAVSFSDNTKELENGDYKYCVIPVYPIECDLDEKCFETNINVGVINYKDNITIYPNPATNVINIFGDSVLEVKIYNNIGQLILNEYNTNEINVSKLTNGIYILSIETLTGNTIQKKITINR